MVRLCQGDPIIVPTNHLDNFMLQPETLKQVLDNHKGNVSCLIFCNPCNPSGSVPSKDHLLSLVAVLDQHPDVIVVSDEIYERILFDNVTHCSFGSISDIRHRTVVINGPSKAFAMTGYRIGFSVAPLSIAKAIAKLQSQITSCASSIAQHATAAAYTKVPQSWNDDTVLSLKRKRDLTLDLLRQIPGLSCASPQGAFYLFPKVSNYFGKKFRSDGGSKEIIIDNSYTFCKELLKEYQVALVPGEAFGMENNVRICFAANESTLVQSMRRLKKFILSLYD